MCSSLELDCAIEALNNLSLDIDGYKRDAASGKLVMEMGETVSSTFELL